MDKNRSIPKPVIRKFEHTEDREDLLASREKIKQDKYQGLTLKMILCPLFNNNTGS